MSLGKRDIVKNISSKAQISSSLSSKILEGFLKIVSTESKNNPVKISNFGTFILKHKINAYKKAQKYLIIVNYFNIIKKQK